MIPGLGRDVRSWSNLPRSMVISLKKGWINSIGIFHGYVSHNQMVYPIIIPLFTMFFTIKSQFSYGKPIKLPRFMAYYNGYTIYTIYIYTIYIYHIYTIYIYTIYIYTIYIYIPCNGYYNGHVAIYNIYYTSNFLGPGTTFPLRSPVVMPRWPSASPASPASPVAWQRGTRRVLKRATGGPLRIPNMEDFRLKMEEYHGDIMD